MLLGFLCKNEADFEDFCERVNKVCPSFQMGDEPQLTSQMPRKIFTVQDEPPTWDDNDDPGMESVSDASSGREREGLESKSKSSQDGHGSTPIASPIPIPMPEMGKDQDQELETLRDEDEFEYDDATTTTTSTSMNTNTRKNAIEIEADSARIEGMKQPAIMQAERDRVSLEDQGQGEEQEGEGGQKPRPPKPRPLQSMGPVGTDSWIRPGTSGQAAPNGKSVI
jgi:cysteine protease ATG4